MAEWAIGRRIVGNAAQASALSALGLMGETIALRAADFALLRGNQLSPAAATLWPRTRCRHSGEAMIATLSGMAALPHCAQVAMLMQTAFPPDYGEARTESQLRGALLLAGTTLYLAD